MKKKIVKDIRSIRIMLYCFELNDKTLIIKQVALNWRHGRSESQV